MAETTRRRFLPGGGRRGDVDMTEGSIPKHILTFALPLLVGNIFQQLYNMVDTWVVGNYVSSEAMAAVGSVGPIINMLIGFFLGLASGAGVVISQYYGAKNDEGVEKTVHTSLMMTLVMAVVFTGIGMGMTPFMVDMMGTPENVRPDTTTYLSIYFAGVAGLMLYNMGAGILRAVGDSRRPFYFLVVSAVMNTVLDLVFVIAFDMGVAGVALATILSQATSAVLVIVVLLRAGSAIRFSPRRLRIHWPTMGRIVKVGIPAAVQMALEGAARLHIANRRSGSWKAAGELVDRINREERDRVRGDTFCTFEESAGDMYVSPTAAQWVQPEIPDEVYEEVRRKWLAGEPG